MVDPYDPSRYVMHVQGILGTYNCSWQFEVESASNIMLYDIYHPEGNLVEDETIVKAEISTAPYVIIPTLGERLDFSYSFPANSRVIVRIIDLNGIFITSIVDKYYETGGVVERYEDTSDWDGRDHLGQIVSPGTYLIIKISMSILLSIFFICNWCRDLYCRIFNKNNTQIKLITI